MKSILLNTFFTIFICLAFQNFLLAQSIAPDAFDRGKSVEKDPMQKQYIIKNDGTQIEGDKLEWKSGLIDKKEAVMDGKAYPTSDIKGARIGNGYFAKINKELARRIVFGKINVYALGKIHIVTGRDNYHYAPKPTVSWQESTVRITYKYYSQIGENGDIKKLDDVDDIRKLLSDCPVALSMLDSKKDEVKVALKKEGGYLNKVFEIYNNDCQPASK